MAIVPGPIPETPRPPKGTNPIFNFDQGLQKIPVFRQMAILFQNIPAIMFSFLLILFLLWLIIFSRMLIDELNYVPPESVILMNSPKPWQETTTNVTIDLQISTLQNPENLTVSLKIDDATFQDLKVKQIDRNLVSISGVWQLPRTMLLGFKNMELSIYNTSSNSPVLVNYTQIPIFVTAGKR